MLSLRPGFNPVSVAMKKNSARFAGNHLAGSADRTIHSPHRACAHRFIELNLQTGIAALTDALEKEVSVHL